MTAQITWSVQSMDCYPQAQGQTDVVFSIVYICRGTETVNNVTYTANTSGSVNVTYTAGSPYTPYSQLTETQVLGWVFTALGDQVKAENEAVVQANINLQENPTVVSPPLPWVPPVVPVSTPAPEPIKA